MPDLSFQVEGAEVTPFAMVPLLTFRLRVTNASPDETIHNVVLRCQIQIEATRRHYRPDEEARLRDLFGEPERWGQTLRAMLWTHASVVVPPFTGETTAELPVACTYDFNVAATKYFYALEDGEIPLDFLFSGSVFYQDRRGRPAGGADLVVAGGALPPAGEDLAAADGHLLPEHRLGRSCGGTCSTGCTSTRCGHGIPTWEQAVERILPPVDEEAPV